MDTKPLAVNEYHAHIYFNPGTYQSAVTLHDSIKKKFASQVMVYDIANGPRGPHISPMFGIDIPLPFFVDVLGFLLINHGPHPVLIHPVTGKELLDHTHHALWLGPPQPLDLARLGYD